MENRFKSMHLETSLVGRMAELTDNVQKALFFRHRKNHWVCKVTNILLSNVLVWSKTGSKISTWWPWGPVYYRTDGWTNGHFPESIFFRNPKNHWVYKVSTIFISKRLILVLVWSKTGSKASTLVTSLLGRMAKLTDNFQKAPFSTPKKPLILQSSRDLDKQLTFTQRLWSIEGNS